MTDSLQRRRGVALLTIGLAATAFAVLYAIALGTESGRDLDAVIVETDVGRGWAVRTAQAILDSVNVVTVALAAAVIAVWALRRHGARSAGRVVGGLAGTYASVLVSERLFARTDPVGGETLRRLGEGFYPSGHAALVAALALAAVMAAKGPRERLVTAVVGGAVALLIGVINVVVHAHYPSDVVGGWLLASAWMLGATRLIGAPTSPSRDGATAPTREAGARAWTP